MNNTAVLQHLDDAIAELTAQLAALQEARSVLTGETESAPRRGRPKKVAADPVPAKTKAGRRKMSPETIEKMRASQAKRWAKKRAAEKKAAKESAKPAPKAKGKVKSARKPKAKATPKSPKPTRVSLLRAKSGE